ncbi:glucoside xylosyltransferase 2 isoform X2 [Eupeodes corollae]|uniref:glucoside xylosyltransferase 2 isoform X2 n=1 Tax=Eupeodes corollae TaxID=290404 RepID=UPI0024900347|nr:glucoside xylosyltransferase 2 isoform X2 [Eupeodes corollae]
MIRLRNILPLLTAIFLTLTYTYVYMCKKTTTDFKKVICPKKDEYASITRSAVSITVVACGSKVEEALTMVKSALIYSDARTVLTFNKNVYNPFSFKVSSLRFPKSEEKDWKNLFKPCAAQRLFLPSLLRNTDATLYVDTDVLFLSSALDTWSHFKNFNASQIAGLSPEHEDTQIGWYNRFARHPFYGRLGVNSGVMLMNLTRMRLFDWENEILKLYKEYKSQITWGDQDLINILFYYHPDKLYIFPCIFNYRPDHCMYVNVCNITNGIHIFHGNRGYFHTNKQPIFKKIYETIRTFELKKYNFLLFPYHLDRILSTSLQNTSMCFKIKNKIGSQYFPYQ